MKRFDYSFLNNGLLAASLVNLTSGIVSLKTMEEVWKEEHKRIFTGLELAARFQAVKWSNEMEGITADDGRLWAIIHQNSLPLNQVELGIVGYMNALDVIALSYAQMDFCLNDILQLYGNLKLISGREDSSRYKNVERIIGGEQEQLDFFPSVFIEDTVLAMEQLEQAYLKARDDSNINQLLLIPCVVMDFFCIQPFWADNNRMSTLLSRLLLYKNGYDVGKYISLEEQIKKYEGIYDASLHCSLRYWSESESRYFQFIECFLFVLYQCYQELEKRLMVSTEKKMTKKARVEATALNSLHPISKAEICLILPDVSPTTIEAALGIMVKNGSLRRIGQTRSARYIRA